MLTTTKRQTKGNYILNASPTKTPPTRMVSRETPNAPTDSLAVRSVLISDENALPSMTADIGPFKHYPSLAFMPQGMLLKSDPIASALLSPSNSNRRLRSVGNRHDHIRDFQFKQRHLLFRSRGLQFAGSRWRTFERGFQNELNPEPDNPKWEVGWTTGLEPATAGITIRGSTS